jgi:hypothetical protein
MYLELNYNRLVAGGVAKISNMYMFEILIRYLDADVHCIALSIL